jgi:hypothetical protein
VEILLNPQFSEYRKKEIAEAAIAIESSWNNNFDPVYFKGQMDMLNRIINIPSRLAGTAEEKLMAKKLKIEATVEFEKLRFKKLMGSDE